jgi:hypothetical protein
VDKLHAEQGGGRMSTDKEEKESDGGTTIYKTSDIHFSAYLGALDVPLVNTEREESGDGRTKVMFVFKVPTSNLRQLKAQFFGGTGTVKVQKFVQQLRNLKSMCFV